MNMIFHVDEVDEVIIRGPLARGIISQPRGKT
jgi:hypothetical protein